MHRHSSREGKTMHRRLSIACLALGLAVASAAAQMPKYGVTVKTDNKTDFTKFKSYAWENGWQSYDKAVHQQILDAVDREMKGLGLERRESPPADMTVTYGTLRRTDTDLNSKSADKRQYAVGSLVVLIRDSATRKELFRARADKPIDAAPDKVQAVIDEVVAEMFAKYPTRK
jgi:hypothetical protein